MTKANLISAVAEKSGLTKKDAEKAVNAVTASISEALGAGEKVQLIGFGTFEVRDRAARDCRNPATGEMMHVPATKVPAFKAGSALKELVK